jgi:hypothetical protein
MKNIAKFLSRAGEDRCVIAILLLTTLVSALSLPVNPWPRDFWFETQYWLFGTFPGQDNYTPIAAPAVFFRMIHLCALALGLDTRGELYLASLTQNALLFLTTCFVYYSCKLLRIGMTAGVVAFLFLVFVLSTGLAQAFWSENLVLFLFSVVLYFNLKIYYERAESARGFWPLAIGSSFLVGVLTVTRMTPIFLIPALFFLFFWRLSYMRLFAYLGLASVLTALLLTGMIASNELRFGRAELTNSSGRHLWQGVSPIVERALASADSTEYLELKEINQSLQGKRFWEIRLPDDDRREYQGEELLGRIAREAIRSAPLMYLRMGLMDFVTTVGRAPYRLGFGERDTHYDPLNTETPLPAVGETILPRSAVRSAAGLFRLVFLSSRQLYPVVIFFVLSTYVMLLLQRARVLPFQPPKQREHLKPGTAAVTRFLLLGVPLVGLVMAGARNAVEFCMTLGLCAIVLILQLKIIRAAAANPEKLKSFTPPSSGVVYTFSSLFFFGSLWFNWQVEWNNTRNVIPYLPFLAVIFGLALTYWLRARKQPHEQSGRPSRTGGSFA